MRILIHCLLFLLFAFVSKPSICQITTSDLKPIIEIIKDESFIAQIKGGTISLGGKEQISHTGISPTIDLYLSTKHLLTEKSDIANAFYIEKNKDAIKEYSDRLFKDLYYDLKPDNGFIKHLPLGFASFNGSLVFFQKDIYHDKSLNTARLTYDERVKMIATDGITPLLDKFKKLMSVEEIKYFCLMYPYIARDFTSDSILSAEGEMVTILISKEDLKKYFDLDATAQEIFKSANIYGSGGGSNVRKVALN